MTGFLPTTGIFVASAPVDLRRAFDGLAILVRNSLAHDPLDGSLYVFSHRRRDRIKILFWELGGYWLCTRRLDKGTFRRPMRDEAVARYTREDLTLVLGGIDRAQTRPLALREVNADAARRGVFKTLLAEEHYLGYGSAVGENLKKLLCQEDGRPLAAWLFGAAAWRCEVRIEVVETFVDRSRFEGTCHAASNWAEVGPTAGRSRGDRYGTMKVPVKAVYLYPLHRAFRPR